MEEGCGFICLPFYPISLADALLVPGIQPLALRDIWRIFSQLVEAVHRQ